MNKDFFISYVVPCYNVEQYLPRCIKSLECQQIDGFDVEFVLVNDGSKDGTLKLINEFAKRDERVVVIDQLNQGVCKARNVGLNLARGKYIFFLDGDDWLTDDASEKIFKAGNKGFPDILIMGNYKAYEGKPESETIWIDASKCTIPGTYEKNSFLDNAKKLPVSFKVYRTDFLKQRDITFDSSLIVGELYSFFICALAEADKVGISDDYIMYYLRRKEGSAVSQLNPERDLHILDTLQIIDNTIVSKCPKIGEVNGFHKTLFWLITSFSVMKYAKRIGFRPEIGALICQVKNDPVYKGLMKNIIADSYSIINRYCVLSLMLLYLPVSVSYRIIRSGIKLYMLLIPIRWRH